MHVCPFCGKQFKFGRRPLNLSLKKNSACSASSLSSMISPSLNKMHECKILFYKEENRTKRAAQIPRVLVRKKSQGQFDSIKFKLAEMISFASDPRVHTATSNRVNHRCTASRSTVVHCIIAVKSRSTFLLGIKVILHPRPDRQMTSRSVD